MTNPQSSPVIGITSDLDTEPRPIIDLANAKNLLYLPEDCLIAIIRKMPVHNLLAIATTCKRLRTIAHIVFKSTPANRILDIRQRINNGNPLSVHKLEQYLQQFGHYITEIQLDLSDGNDKKYQALMPYRQPIMQQIIRHCSGTLRKLHLNCFVLNSMNLMDTEIVLQAMELFRNLTHLKLENCGSLKKCLPLIAAAKELSLLYDRFSDTDLQLNIPNLTELTINGYFKQLQLIQGFIQRHLKHLKKFRSEVISLNYENIIRKMVHTEDLYIRTQNVIVDSETDSNPFDLPILRKFTFRYREQNLNRWIHKMAISSFTSKSLQEFSFSGPIDDLLIESISKFTNLKMLRLYGFCELGVSNNSVIKSLTNLTKLNSFTGHYYIAKYLYSLGPINYLHIFNYDQNPDFVEIINNFHTLHELKITECHPNLPIFGPIAYNFNVWNSKNLKQLQRFTYKYDDRGILCDSPPKDGANEWLNYLGTTKSQFTLETIEIDNCVVNVDTFVVLRQFPNLRSLTIGYATDEHLNMICNLKQLNQLALYSNTCNITWNGVLNCIKHLPNIHKLKYRLDRKRSGLILNSSIYNQLVDIFRKRNIQFIFEFAKFDAGYPFNYADNANFNDEFVQIVIICLSEREKF